MLKAIKLSYHQFIEDIYQQLLANVLKESLTAESMIKNSGKIEKMCERITPHTKSIVELTSSEGIIHEEASKRLKNLRKIYEEADKYKKVGDMREKILGIRNPFQF